MYNHNKMYCHRKSQGYMCICRNAEGVQVGNPWSKAYRWTQG